ncbi:cytidylate kinase [Prochlorococcus marinus str. MIT 9312]|uniref:Bifunctional pantoate ligase/cytidylate kinase n=1 Tax=Prochlorococcus marinus (strain MIT 9312) TaxID=74546 RepID=PANCY_PROM9|nr:bifunctional pantoate--beta-alanine ligase/(d)CMP kinase [Prochlorococcus marinus]Q318F2.1 RecName: Full=Bifunctional pantoate ligase/cytidylate kinase; Includes: RecName: Full=Pantothenate synthetase; Short=PS; AltName: Full=Pantoate--beta-alanine ligase; AltName: Full=Pantoate-activating enzyme; Includes: RecName: Full=Cytidylate kinase; Short=CK; AltName: Full=Cytidine monophosphate kinase; Short=CMP kinase [Prochlorococcus marinus str. MIT 9312]ABB50743.1 cytidylate kinase [Prochlorococcus
MKKVIIRKTEEIKNWRRNINSDINFIPTMGNLHNGHKTLISTAKNANSNVNLVSIFVNPLQFDNKSDLENYPKTIDNDIKISFENGADVIFIPSTEEIYPSDNKNITFLKAPLELSSSLCGLNRIGHFDGVCTVVYKLLNLIKPKNLYLGEKDWQQLLILKNLVLTKKLDVAIKSIPTQRDFDGIPLSSRNVHLSNNERKLIRFFSHELLVAKENFQQEKKINLKEIIQKLSAQKISIEYLEHLHPYTLQESKVEDNISILAGAIRCGETRLIDHVFLMKRSPIIAIDGPAGSGKSTVTQLIAKKLKLLYLDTGAMYRALSWLLIKENIDYKEEKKLQNILKDISIVFKSNTNSQQDVFINNYCVTEEIRSQEISSIVSKISSIKEVREFLVEEQRKIGESGGLVAEGRDIGTTVFPDAELKIFLTASIDERAKRRKSDKKSKDSQEIDLHKLKELIKKRDFEDSNREISPLIKANDAIEIITDGCSINEVVDKIIDLYNDKIPKETQIR